MSERLTLGQLKAMNDIDSREKWVTGTFPFDVATCGRCMTMHDSEYITRCGHEELRRGMLAMPRSGCFHGSVFVENLRANLEELYALRLFYDHLYPQTIEPKFEEREAQVERLRREHYDERAGTR